MRPTVGFALCGSFCTFRKAIDALRALTAQYTVVPIFSDAAWETDTRFGASADFRAEVTALCGTEPLHTLAQVEPLGPKHLLDLLIVAPCTGNTLGKLANGIADSPVSFACKAHLRNGRPVLLAVSTNDGLSGSAANLGALLARRHFYFVPFGQDSPTGKPASLVAHFSLLPEAAEAALRGEQLQPLLVGGLAKTGGSGYTRDTIQMKRRKHYAAVQHHHPGLPGRGISGKMRGLHSGPDVSGF